MRQHMLRDRLRGRYGTMAGRGLMGERARALDALVIAMEDSKEVDLTTCGCELQAWAQHWWKKLEGHLIQEEAVITQVGGTLEDSLESVDSGLAGPTGSQASATVLGEGALPVQVYEAQGGETMTAPVDEDLNARLEEERELEVEMEKENEAQQKRLLERQLADYEKDAEDEEQADLQR